MVDVKRINEIIDGSGYKREKIAEVLGIATSSLWNKTRGVTEFSLAEATKFCELFHIDDPSERSAIFFTSDVSINAYKEDT